MELKFIKSALKPNDWIHDSRKEVAFIGRSNVGKSSLINALFHTSIVKVSTTPGRTRLINFFDTNKNYRVVDLPGYGYSKININDVLKINNNVTLYLNNRENLSLIILVVDINVVTIKDTNMIQELIKINKPFVIVLNKIDKLSKSYFDNNKTKIANFLNIDVNKLIPISAKKGTNLNNLLLVINKSVE